MRQTVSFLEVLIGVSIVGIIAAIVVPRFYAHKMPVYPDHSLVRYMYIEQGGHGETIHIGLPSAETMHSVVDAFSFKCMSRSSYKWSFPDTVVYGTNGYQIFTATTIDDYILSNPQDGKDEDNPHDEFDEYVVYVPDVARKTYDLCRVSFWNDTPKQHEIEYADFTIQPLEH